MASVAQFVQLGPINENIGASWTLTHYEAGTTTLKNLWTDRAKTTTAAQPVVADSRGIMSFYGDGLYDLIAKDSAGNTLYTWTNVFFGDASTVLHQEGAAISSAATLVLGTDGDYQHVSGTTGPTTAISGTQPFVILTFDSTPTWTDGATLQLRNRVSRQMRTDETVIFVNDGAGVWREIAPVLRLANAQYFTGRNAAGTAEVNILRINSSNLLELPTAISGGVTVTDGGVTVNGGDITLDTDVRILESKATDIASAATIAAPAAGFADCTGTTTITGVSTTLQAGAKFRLRFTGTGLNLTHNATSFISPWGRDYRTVTNEIIEFLSVGSGNYIFYSLNGPRERVGVTIEANVSSAPAGYLDEDGTAVSRTTYAGLFAEISTTFGVGDGSTTFNVPDSRGRAVINVDGAANRITAASTNGANADTLGGVGGAETHTLSTSEMPSHNHMPIGDNNTGGSGGVGNRMATISGDLQAVSVTLTNGLITAAGGGGAHSNTQPWIAKKKFIRF